jgi:4,5-DOPA dioxygenase extradiol
MSEAEALGGRGRQDDERRRRVPVLFVSHGAPASLVDAEYGNALRRLSARQLMLDGIVVVSSHWEALRPIRVTTADAPRLLPDFGNMASPVERFSYPCRGHAGLANRVISLLERSGIAAVPDPGQGLDHGAWIPIAIAYPSGRVPVVQVSLPLPGEPEDVLAIGRALATLRDENVLLLGSGGIVHNPHRLRASSFDSEPESWAFGFDEWVREQLGKLDVEALTQYRRLAPYAKEAAPTPEHFAPLFFVLGAREPGDRVYHVFEGFRYGNLSMRSFVLAGRRREPAIGQPPR